MIKIIILLALFSVAASAGLIYMVDDPLKKKIAFGVTVLFMGLTVAAGIMIEKYVDSKRQDCILVEENGEVYYKEVTIKEEHKYDGRVRKFIKKHTPKNNINLPEEEEFEKPTVSQTDSVKKGN